MVVSVGFWGGAADVEAGFLSAAVALAVEVTDQPSHRLEEAMAGKGVKPLT